MPGSTRSRSPGLIRWKAAFVARPSRSLLEFIACTLLYCLIPNCAVRWRDGAIGALCAVVRDRDPKDRRFPIYIGDDVLVPDGVRRARRDPDLPAVDVFLVDGRSCSAPWSRPTCRPGGSTSASVISARAACGSALALAMIAALARAQQHGGTSRTAGAGAPSSASPTTVARRAPEADWPKPALSPRPKRAAGCLPGTRKTRRCPICTRRLTCRWRAAGLCASTRHGRRWSRRRWIRSSPPRARRCR